MVKDTELSYLAGIVDGEGSIEIVKESSKNLYYRIKIGIYNTNKDLLTFCTSIAPTASNIKTYNYGPTRKDVHRVYWHGEVAVALLNQIYKYLVIKKKHADIALEFYTANETYWKSNSKFGPASPKILTEREAFYQKMKSLNKRGVYNGKES